MFVAQQGEEIVGFAGIDEPYLAWLHVAPAHYRHGVGRALLRHCVARLGDDAWTLACGNNHAALSLYESEGFVIESRFTGDNAGYKGDSARLALHPGRRGWLKPRKSEAPGRQGAGGRRAAADGRLRPRTSCRRTNVSEPLVVIAAFDHPHQARVLAGRLEVEGIVVALQDENAAALSMWPETGGVKVLVHEKAAARARAIHEGARSTTGAE